MTIEMRIYQDEAYAKVFALIEKEIMKSKDRGDTHAVSVLEVLLAKARALEKT